MAIFRPNYPDDPQNSPDTPGQTGTFETPRTPWNDAEMQEVRQFSHDWRTEHGITQGQEGDLEIAYENLRMAGYGHDDARQGAINVLGWQAPAPPAWQELPPTVTPTPIEFPSTGGGGGGAPSGGGGVGTPDYGGFNIPPPVYRGGGGGGVPSYIPPTPVFTPPPYTPPPAFVPPTYTPPPAFSYADYAPGQAFSYSDYAPGQAFSYADYAPTTAADLYADPSYQFRVNEGQQALANSATVRGVANTGATLKDFINYGQNAASQEFGAVDARRMQDYTTNRAGAFQGWAANDAQRQQDYATARGNAFQNWQANEAQRQQDYTIGRQGAVDTYNTNYQTQYQDPYKLNYQAATDAYNTNYQTQYSDPYKIAYQGAIDAFSPQMTAYQTQAQAGQHEADQDRSYDYQTWLQQYNMWRANRNDTFDERYKITALQ